MNAIAWPMMISNYPYLENKLLYFLNSKETYFLNISTFLEK